MFAVFLVEELTEPLPCFSGLSVFKTQHCLPRTFGGRTSLVQGGIAGQQASEFNTYSERPPQGFSRLCGHINARLDSERERPWGSHNRAKTLNTLHLTNCPWGWVGDTVSDSFISFSFFLFNFSRHCFVPLKTKVVSKSHLLEKSCCCTLVNCNEKILYHMVLLK